MNTLENTTIAKLVLVVQDAERKVDAFCALFGIERPKIVATNPAPLEAGSRNYTEYRRGRITGRVKMANLTMGKMILEVIEPVDYDSPWAEYLRRHGEGIFSIVFTVNDFEGQTRVLEGAGMERYHLGEYGAGRYAYFTTEEALGITLCLQNLSPLERR